jgi:hypothetical protein
MRTVLPLSCSPSACGGAQLGGCRLFELGTAAFELLDRSFGGAARQLAGNQVVAGIACLDLDDVAQVTELADLFSTE